MSNQDATPQGPTKAGDTRKPCRDGEYIVVDISPGPVSTNTIIMRDATSARDALDGRLALIHDRVAANRIGRWLVTDGRLHSSTRCGARRAA